MNQYLFCPVLSKMYKKKTDNTKLDNIWNEWKRFVDKQVKPVGLKVSGKDLYKIKIN